jgi:plastocyanin
VSSRIPGLDRLLHKNSKAEVGPVTNLNGEVVQGTEESSDTMEIQVSSSVSIKQPELKQPERQKTSEAEITVIRATKPPLKSLPPIASNTFEGKISGSVTLLANDQTITPEGLIVRLRRIDGKPINSALRNVSYELDMQDKTYKPGQLVINKGDAIQFINRDNIQHNVFSSSAQNAFDLGTFGGGLARSVKLNEEGIVKVYCNIHPNMATYVAVDDISWSQVIKGTDGYFVFEGLPDTEYQLSIWSIRGEKTQKLSLAKDEHKHLTLEFDTSRYVAQPHSNKFGERYKNKSKQSVRPDLDELF